MARVRRDGQIFMIELESQAEAVTFYKDIVSKKDITKMEVRIKKLFKDLEDEIVRSLF